MSKEKQKVEHSPAFAGEHIRDADLHSILGGGEPGFQFVEMIETDTKGSPSTETKSSLSAKTEGSLSAKTEGSLSAKTEGSLSAKTEGSLSAKIEGSLSAETENSLSAKAKNFLSDLKNIEIFGPPLSEIRPKSPFGLIIRIEMKDGSVDTSKLSVRDLEAVIEKKIGDFIDQIKGVSHKFVRDDIEIRISREAVENGLTFEGLAAILKELIMEEFPYVAGVFVQILTDEKKVLEKAEKARGVYKKRDERALSLHDENVKTFYGCKICQISSPAHVCVITPDRPSVCGTINWFEAGAACLSNPDGSVFEIEKGDLIDEKSGEYSGVAAAVAAGSGGENSRVLLYSLTESPHTTGSVFDVIAFYIPEAGGIGLIDRRSKSPAVNGLTFDEMMIFTGYGQQISGFSGVGETYMLSEKFLQKEGGWENIVWMT